MRRLEIGDAELCDQCHRMFRPASPCERYCSDECRSRAGRQAFMMGVGRVKARTEPRDIRTLPLIPLWLILAADGTLAAPLRGLVERTQA